MISVLNVPFRCIGAIQAEILVQLCSLSIKYELVSSVFVDRSVPFCLSLTISLI